MAMKQNPRALRNNNRRLFVEALQARQLMAVDVSLSNGTLGIAGDGGSNQVEIREIGGQLRIDTESGSTFFNRAQVTKISFYGNAGNDYVKNFTGVKMEAYGQDGFDTLIGGSGDDLLNGGSGDDILEGGIGNDELTGGDGNDTYVFRGTGLGSDTISDFVGENTLDFTGMSTGVRILLRNIYFQAVNEDLSLKLGRNDSIDNVLGSEFDDKINGNDLVNKIYGNSGNDEILGYGGDDILNGGSGNDTLDGGKGNDDLTGGGGNDTYRFRGNGLGEDTIHDFVGTNTLDFSGMSSRVRIALRNIYFQTVNENITLKLGRDDAIDHVLGSEFDDDILGNDLDNQLFGNGGDDEIFGYAGNDDLYGGLGIDHLFGGSGLDGLFGGDGVDFLSGGAHADRFLDQVKERDIFSDFMDEDVRIDFADLPNGATITSSRGTNVFAPGFWTQNEIEDVDVALHDLHLVVGNTKLLKTSVEGKRITFQRAGAHISGDTPNLLGWNTDGTGKIGLTQGSLRSDPTLWTTIYHEISHNFDDPAENGFINDFRKISKWTPVGERTSFPGIVQEYCISLDKEWEYTDVDANFTRDYGRNNPHDDYATTWEFYFMERYHQDRLQNTGLRDVSAKHQNVDQFFASLS